MDLHILINGLKEGDHNAFMEVYDLYYDKLNSFINRYVHSRKVAGDLTRYVFVKLWEKRNFLDKVVHFNTYSCRIAKNHTLASLKKVSRSDVMPNEILNESQFS